MFEWSNSYSVGIQSIDAQHQNLFALGRELHTAMSNGQGRASLAKILDRLVQYTSVHFAHEERLMRLADYPELAGHANEHALLTRKVLQFQKDFEAGRAVMTVQLLTFLKDWLHHHIQGSDLKYAPHVKNLA
jgi:hemerythrin-like metal-binding protein